MQRNRKIPISALTKSTAESPDHYGKLIVMLYCKFSSKPLSGSISIEDKKFIFQIKIAKLPQLSITSIWNGIKYEKVVQFLIKINLLTLLMHGVFDLVELTCLFAYNPFSHSNNRKQ